MNPQFCVANGTLVALDNFHSWGHQAADSFSSDAAWATGNFQHWGLGLASGVHGAGHAAWDLTSAGFNAGMHGAGHVAGFGLDLASAGMHGAGHVAGFGLGLAAAGAQVGAHGVRHTVGFARGAAGAAGHLALNAATLSRPFDGHHATDHIVRNFANRM